MKKNILFSLLLFISFCANAQLPITPDFVYNLRNVQQIRDNFGAFAETNAILTQGYYSPKDGGAAYYIVEADNIQTDNGGDIIRISPTLIARLTPTLPVNAKQFGAKGDNITDDTNTIQSAINYCIVNKINNLKISQGTYRISNSLVIENFGITTPSRPSGLFITGDGADSTIIKSLSSHVGPMIDIKGLPSSGSYINGGGLKGILFDGSYVGDSTNHGISFIGWWYATLENCKIKNFKGDGIHQITDLITNPNPDWSASVNIQFKRCGIERCGGFGFNNTGLQGAPGYLFEQCTFTLCKKGGAYVQSSSMRFTSCSFSALGWQSEIDTVNPDDVYGIHYGGNSVTVNSRHIVEGCEFDNNKTAHIACSYLANSRINNNRFIHEDRPGNIVPSEKSIIFAPNSADEAMKNIEFNSNFFRIFSSPVTVFDWEHTSNVSDIYLKMNTITDNTGGTAVITPFEGYTTSNHHIKNNYVIDNRQGGSENTIVSVGSPAPFYIGSITPNSAPSGQIGGLHPLVFDIKDPIFDDGNFQNLYYDTTTGVFKCPYTGFYDINVYLTLRSLLVNQQARLHIKKNGTIIFSDYVWGNSYPRTNMDLATKFFANADDEISIEIGTDGLLQIEPIEVFGFNRLSIELAK